MKEFDFYSKLTTSDQEYLTSNSKYIEVPSDTILFYQGDICEDILLLQEGTVQLYISANLGEKLSLYEISKGEQCIINTSSTLSQSEAIATAESKTFIKGYLVPKKVSKELMRRSLVYQEYIFSLFSLKFSALTTLIEDIKFKRLDQRVLDFLKNKNLTMIEITHEILADELGTSRVVISRVLKDLEKQNYIKLHRKRIELLT